MFLPLEIKILVFAPPCNILCQSIFIYKFVYLLQLCRLSLWPSQDKVSVKIRADFLKEEFRINTIRLTNYINKDSKTFMDFHFVHWIYILIFILASLVRITNRATFLHFILCFLKVYSVFNKWTACLHNFYITFAVPFIYISCTANFIGGNDVSIHRNRTRKKKTVFCIFKHASLMIRVFRVWISSSS